MSRSQKQQELNQILEKLLKDGARVLAKPISKLRNLSMTLGSFSDAYKIAKVKPLFKKGSKTDPSSTDQYLYFFCYLKSLKELFLTKQKSSLVLIRSYMAINPVLGKTTQDMSFFFE